MALEYVIYTDESSDRGSYFSNFYGGALIRSTDLEAVEHRLEAVKLELGLHGEFKWSKVTDQYLAKYIRLMEEVFGFVAGGMIKIRIMFTQNFHRPQGLTREQKDSRYHLLYYQFLKHAFGLHFSGVPGELIGLRIILDQLPGTREQNAVLKGYLAALGNSAGFRQANLQAGLDRIVEVESHKHVILQGLDVILGAMQFKLNNKHLEKPEGARTRGKRTIAKEKLYKAMHKHIRDLHPNFNIGISTGVRGDRANRWRDPYRHWLFIPTNHTLDYGKTK